MFANNYQIVTYPFPIGRLRKHWRTWRIIFNTIRNDKVKHQFPQLWKIWQFKIKITKVPQEK